MECWRDVTTRPSHSASFLPAVSLQKRMLKATFILSEPGIQKLKNLAIAENSKKREIVHVSSFVVACAHLWTCLAKSAATAGEEVDDDEPEYFMFTVNCRGRLNPPLPDNYFGNCIAMVMTELTHGKLRGEEGFLAAAEAISGTIEKTVGNGRGTIDGSPKLYLNVYDRLGEMVGKRILTVVGSSGFDFYGIEFGWGRPIKFEASHGDNEMQIAWFSNSREYRGGVEVGVSMPKVKMDAFAASFKQGLTQETEKLWCKM
ncbi:hypothetical protein CASFOL_038404 [Castilleja foliolosa]|uniref:Uncharacterized protein n=1 Tax=Castilleja foliolosa TaxID=1961234 RepID=A0ABD3BKW0_9LAMI